MALNINGTTGISGVDGSASAASIAGTDANTGLSFASDTVNINTGGSTRATVDSSGNLGVGNTNPSSFHSSGQNLVIGSGSGEEGMTIYSGTGSGGVLNFADGTTSSDSYEGRIIYNHGDNSMRFHVNDGAERMRILSDGDIVVGSYAAEYYESFTISPNHDNGAPRITFSRAPSSAVSIVIAFKNAGGQIGRIEHDNTSCGIFSSSDYRVKENVVSISDGITRLKTLKPYKFNFIENPTKIVDGFFAHEVSSTVPEAVSGTKDQVDSDGNPEYQAIDQSKLVPLLTAALQEAVAKIETLETKVAALEAG